MIQFGVHKKLVMLIKVCINESDSSVQVRKNLSDMFPIRNVLKQGDDLLPLLLNCALEYIIKIVQVIQDGLQLNGTLQFWFMLIMLIYWAEAIML